MRALQCRLEDLVETLDSSQGLRSQGLQSSVPWFDAGAGRFTLWGAKRGQPCNEVSSHFQPRPALQLRGQSGRATRPEPCRQGHAGTCRDEPGSPGLPAQMAQLEDRPERLQKTLSLKEREPSCRVSSETSRQAA